MSTAFHALSFTTLLLRRWLLYYSLLPSLIRLAALQAICWPLVRLTLYVFGTQQPLAAWIVIGSTTAFSDVVARWVTSNVADAPLPDDVRAIEKGSSVFFKLVMGDPGVTEVEDSEETDEEDHLAEDELLEEFRAADSALAAINHDASRGDQVAQQWHAFDNARRPMDDRALALSRARARAAARAVNARHNAKANKARLRAARRRARARAQKLQVTSRRVFHWDVAVRRNVIPIAIMSYVSMWILLVDGM